MLSKEIDLLIKQEQERQKNSINLIASENVLDLELANQYGNIFVNKYAEGYPSKRYYAGCEIVNQLEELAIKNCCKAFSSNYANVQPLSGSQANQAILSACLTPGDTILSLKLSSGGHLSHGFHKNLAGQIYKIINYHTLSNGNLDYNEIELLIKEHSPKIIILGFSCFVFDIDFKKIRNFSSEIIILADISHYSGLVITNLMQHPFPFADIIMSTTHKMLGGPRGAIICWNKEKFNIINSGVFPGIQGGPHMNSVLLKSICLERSLTKKYFNHCGQIIKNIQSLAQILQTKCDITIGDNHILIWHLNSKIEAEAMVLLLESNNIVTNFNYTFKGFGIRIGSVCMTSRGWKEAEFEKLGYLILKIIKIKVIDRKEIYALLDKCSLDNYFFINNV